MPDRPNILLITSDQQHWDTLGATNPRIQTPALDRLGREGVRFDRAYCTNPVCSPSRSSIITGLYPAWHHCWTIGVKLPEDVPTVGDALGAAGYDTSLIGKAHFQPLASTPQSLSLECQPTMRDLAFWRSFQGPWYGFQRVELARNHADEAHAGQHYALWLEERGLTDWRKYYQDWPTPPRPGGAHYWMNDGHVWDLPEEYHYSTWTGERTVAAMERAVAQGKPFFTWASFQDPHPPYLVPEPWASMYDPADMVPGRLEDGEFERMPPHFGKTQEERPDFSMYRETYGPHGFHSHRMDDAALRQAMACYYGMISLMDREIGRILEALDRLGIAENTLVLFSTDHGHFLGQHGLVAKGAFHYEDMVRIPMLVRWPGHVPEGTVSHALQSQVDFAPTFLAAAGVEVPGVMQGLDQRAAWASDAPARDHVIVENRHEPTRVHLRTYIDGRYKLTVYRDQAYGELFDLQEDPGEVRNLWDAPEAAATKAEVMHRFLNAELLREPTRMPRVAGA
jgi:arylsulfatase A-like enzyme